MSETGIIGTMLSLSLLAIIALGAWIGYTAKAQTVTTPAIAAAVCAYSSSPPTGTSGTFILVQCDSTGKLKVAP